MRYLIKQRVFSLGDSYDIADERGAVAFQVHGRAFSLGNSLEPEND